LVARIGPGPVSAAEGGALFSMPWLLTYADCDPAGIIYYASAFEIIERVYMAYAVENHVTPDELRAAGVPTPVARSASGDFFEPMAVLDRIRCDLYCDGVGRSSIDWRCAFTRLAGPGEHPAFEGHLRQVYLAGGRPAPVPEMVRKLVGA
jgi:acyl-CoA thioesterase FadM